MGRPISAPSRISPASRRTELGPSRSGEFSIASRTSGWVSSSTKRSAASMSTRSGCGVTRVTWPSRCLASQSATAETVRIGGSTSAPTKSTAARSSSAAEFGRNRAMVSMRQPRRFSAVYRIKKLPCGSSNLLRPGPSCRNCGSASGAGCTRTAPEPGSGTGSRLVTLREMLVLPRAPPVRLHRRAGWRAQPRVLRRRVEDWTT